MDGLEISRESLWMIRTVEACLVGIHEMPRSFRFAEFMGRLPDEVLEAISKAHRRNELESETFRAYGPLWAFVAINVYAFLRGSGKTYDERNLPTRDVILKAHDIAIWAVIEIVRRKLVAEGSPMAMDSDVNMPEDPSLP